MRDGRRYSLYLAVRYSYYLLLTLFFLLPSPFSFSLPPWLAMVHFIFIFHAVIVILLCSMFHVVVVDVVIGDGAVEETQTARGEEKQSVRHRWYCSRMSVVKLRPNSYPPLFERYHYDGYRASIKNKILIPFQNKDHGGGKRIGL